MSEKIPVTLDKLKEMIGDDPEVIKEMVNIFIEDVPKYLDTISGGLSASPQNWDAIAKTCHTLKSTMTFTGREDLVGKAEKLQHQTEVPAEGARIRKVLTVFTHEVTYILEAYNDIYKTL
jgi:HPt (histidine-containing phosphotransfer) domain-containing protein